MGKKYNGFSKSEKIRTKKQKKINNQFHATRWIMTLICFCNENKKKNKNLRIKRTSICVIADRRECKMKKNRKYNLCERWFRLSDSQKIHKIHSVLREYIYCIFIVLLLYTYIKSDQIPKHIEHFVTRNTAAIQFTCSNWWNIEWKKICWKWMIVYFVIGNCKVLLIANNKSQAQTLFSC